VILNEYRKVGIAIASIACIIIFIVTSNIALVGVFLLGYIVSNINFYINEKFLDISGGKKALGRNLSNYFLRIALYAGVMILAFKWQDLTGLILCFIGCLMIRVAILIHTVKEVIKNEHH